MSCRRGARRSTAACVGSLLLLAGSRAALAQVAPNVPWQTIRTAHFRVHFTRPLEEQARRAAFNAEHAYAQLAAELVPPRGTVDLVLSDDVDFSNGSATPLPTNRITIYAHPPVNDRSLRYYDDWNALVITHELTHIFHLDRSRGWWGAAQRVFGRSPVLFPNLFAPAWLSEGLAVYYESRLTGTGRIAGTEHAMLARASAREGRLPRLDELSLTTPRYPGGEGAYAYGSLVIDYLARTRGPGGVRRFVERSSRTPVPFFLDRAASHSFGISFQRAWRQWSDSLNRSAVGLPSAPLRGWRELTEAGRDAVSPRWTSDTALIYSADTGREMPGVYRVDLRGGGGRVGRRNGTGPNAMLADGSLVFSQLDYVGPYRVRSDLYRQSGSRERRLTHGARLSSPDARRDGAIVAVQAVPASTRLVRVAADGRSITPLTVGTPDVQWSEPRWSRDGSRIAAVRWRRGGRTAVVVLDTLGGEQLAIANGHAVISAPAWTPDGRGIVFTSDRGGRTDVYLAGATAVDSRLRRVSATGTGLFTPEVSPSGALLAAALLRADGFHIGAAPFVAEPAASAAVAEFATLPEPDRAGRVDSPRSRYSPWRSLLPTYWLPVAGEANTGTLLGALTTGRDVIGRHAYTAQLAANTRSGEIDASASYRFAGLGLPLLDVRASQAWDRFLVSVPGSAATDLLSGHLRRRSRVASVGLTFQRPRFRTNSWVTVGGEVELRAYSTEPESLLAPYTRRYVLDSESRAVFLSGGWANAQRPALSISPEDGVALAFTARERWLVGQSRSTSGSIAGSARGYKSLDLPGYAHHVLALRAAAGLADARATGEYSAGGVSGESLEVLPGLTLGGEQRTFGARGFAPSRQRGIRALAGSLEYRAPLWTPARGYRLLPVFLSRSSLSVFADGAHAWCRASFPFSPRCATRDAWRDWLASAGAELDLDVALQYDLPYRFRFGVAAPLSSGPSSEGSRASAYFTLGLSF